MAKKQCLFTTEYAHSKYTAMLKGRNAKAKANASQGIPELLRIALKKREVKNKKEKHNKDAKYGWFYYDSRFAIHVYGEGGTVEKYNVFDVVLIVRHARDRKKYLYDIINIKKETSTLFRSRDLTQ